MERLYGRDVRKGRQRPREPHANVASGRRDRRLPDLRAHRPTWRTVEGPPRLLEHLHPQGVLTGALRYAGVGKSYRHPEGGRRLASVQFHHLSRLLRRDDALSVAL